MAESGKNAKGELVGGRHLGSLFVAETYSGPLPPPNMMNEYSDKAQETLMTLVLDEQKLNWRAWAWERLLGFVFSMSCLIGGIFLVNNDKVLLGSAVGIVAVLLALKDFVVRMVEIFGSPDRPKDRNP